MKGKGVPEGTDSIQATGEIKYLGLSMTSEKDMFQG